MIDQAPFHFLSANTPWVYALAEALAHDAPAHAARLYDWQVYWNERPEWPPSVPGAALRRTMRVLPPGYAGRLEWLARPFMRWLVRRARQRLAGRSGTVPWTVAPYPYLAPWVRGVPGERLVYYNLDDYALYRPARAASIREQEDELIQRAARTVCLSQHQVEALHARHPSRAGRILHFPLGVTEAFLHPAPVQPPAKPNTVGYVGNLTDRVDWPFVRAVARQCREAEFVFVGGIEEGAADTPRWRVERKAAFAEPNVRHAGRVPQREVVDYYHRFAVNWIPYDPGHPFNKASCPTKVMDGIASGRPVVSTDVPECRLYPKWIYIAETPSAAADALRHHLDASETHDAEAQVAFAQKHTWPCRAQQLRRLLAEPVSAQA